MRTKNEKNEGPFPESVFPSAVFPRRIFPWMGGGDEEEDNKYGEKNEERQDRANENDRRK